MKYIKFLSICLMASFAMCVSAAINQATITISGEDADGCELSIVEDNTAEANYTSKSIAPFIPASGTILTPQFYAEYGTKQMSYVVNNSIENLSVKFTANAYEDEYVMTFSDVQGQLTLANADTSFVIDATKPYAFTCAKSASITFTVNPVVEYNYTREIATGKWGTICYPEAITTVSGCEVYQFIGKDATKVYAELVEDALEAGKAYLIYATADAQGFSYTDATTASASANNGLIGTFAEYTTTTGDEAAYVVKGTSLVPAALGSTVPANRAYVQKLSDIQGGAPAPGRKYVAFSINNPTAIEAVQAAGMKEGKMIVNGQFVIVKDGKMFNAQGAAL